MLCLVALVLLFLASPFAHAAPTDRIIVRFKAGADGYPVRKEVDAQLEAEFSKLANRPLRLHRATGGRGEFVLKLEKRLPDAEVEAIVNRLRVHPQLEYAVPDRIAFPQLTPNDPRFADQWNLAAGTGINAPGAWDLSTGAAVTVAVLDTGVLPHADLAGRILQGYDFVSISNRANDGDGRDSNTSDPGDWVTSAEASTPGGPFESCPVTSSHWHGTAIAGIIAAAGNNTLGIAGINWLAKILPVRVIGKCGGYTSDIVDGMRWAAGIPVPGVPDNPNPARIVNLSMATPGACDVTWQSAINEVWSRNVMVVAAAGNSGQNIALFSPASCYNAITVAAVDRHGGLAAYSNTGQEVNFSAPGGTGIGADGIVSTSDNGAQGPANDNAFLSAQGTSQAAAHVSGVASLVLSLKPAMTPGQVWSLLSSTTRAFPPDATAQGSFANCAERICGAGIVDARRALLTAASFGGITPRLATGRYDALVSRSDGTVWSLGYSFSPAIMQGITAVVGVSAGANHRIFQRSDGTVWAQGSNDYGQLGDGTGVYQADPVQVQGLTEVAGIAAGTYHSLALTPDGSVWAWGRNDSRQLGDATTTNRLTPVQVAGLSGVVAIAAGASHSLALKSDGTVWVWGDDGAVSGLAPAQVGGLAAVTAMAAGNKFSLALKSDGTVWSWGQNDSGQLGDGTSLNRQTPVQVSGLAGVVAISASRAPSDNEKKFALALKSDGTVWAWGSNQYGQLGDGSFDPTNANPRLAPGQVSGINGVSAIAADFVSVLALKPDGSLYAWGRLGDSTSTDRNTPVQVVLGIPGSGYFITMGRDNAVALRSDGAVYFWGDSIDSPLPLEMSGPGPIVSVVAGDTHFLLLSGGSVWTVGENTWGQLGDGSTTDRWTTVKLAGFDNAAAIAAGTQHSLARKTDGSVWAWGRNDSGQLGDGSFTNRSAPVQVAGLSGVIAIAAGDTHSLALTSDGTVWMWGGVGVLSNSIPVQVSGLSAVTVVAAGNRFSLAVKSDGTLWAWGQNDSGQLGDGTTLNRQTPVRVSGLSGVVAAAASRGNGVTTSFALALKSDGTVWSWGSNQFGQLANGTFDASNANPRLVPGQVSGIGGVSAIAAGAASALALAPDVSLYAWGRNHRGQLGDGTYTDRSGPVRAELLGPFNAGLSDPLSFAAKSDVPVNSVQVSNAVNIVGIDEGTPISIAGGEYSINGGAFTASAGTINNADAVSVRLTASSGYRATTLATLTIGGAARSFSVTTYAADVLPLSYGFTTQWNVALGEQAVSNDITVSGINAPTPISVAGGEYSVNGGPYSAATGTVNNGDAVRLRLPASSAYVTSTTARLTIGGVSAEFMATTLPSPSFTTPPRIAVGVILRSDGTAWTVSGSPVRMTSIGDVVGVAEGLLLRSNGSVWAVGGDQSAPVQVQGLTGFMAFAGRLALKSDGTVWERGSDGVLSGSLLVQLAGLSGVIAIAVDNSHSLALKSDGTVWAWGWNGFGQLGDGSFTDRSTPVQVSGLAGVVAIAAGDLHSLALKSDGTVWAWGDNLYGQLGDGTTSETRSTPVQVSGLTGATAIATGSYHGLALKSDGTVWAWGSNPYGQLADGTFDPTGDNPRRVPAQVSGIGGVSAIAAGDESSVVLKTDGAVWGWGKNTTGQMGDGTHINRSSPVQVIGEGGVGQFNAGVSDLLAFAAKTDVPVSSVQVSNAVNIVGISEGTPIGIAGGEYSINGGAFTSSAGTINNADAVRVRLTAASVYGSTTVATLAIGGAMRSFSATTYAADMLPVAYGFTTQWNLTLGEQAISNDITVSGINAPTPISVEGGEYSVNGGPYSAAAGTVNNGDAVRLRLPASSAYATSTTARLTIGGVSAAFVATTLPSPSFTTPPRIAAGSSYSVMLRSDGTAWAVGQNNHGQLGDGTQETRQWPVRMTSIGAVIGVAAGQDHSLMLRSDGTVWAVGNNEWGQLGDGSGVAQSAPVQVQGLTGVVAIAAGSLHSLALKSDGTVWAWGVGFDGELGDGTTGGVSFRRLTPVQAVGLGGVIAIAAGSQHSLAVKSDGTVWEWGGAGAKSPQDLILVPTQIAGLSGISAVAGGTNFSLALKSDGTVWAWGYNEYGQLGDGTTTRRPTPVQVSGLSSVVGLSADVGSSYNSFALALKSDGTVWAWGSNRYGQLGDGSSDPTNSHPRLVPGRVSAISGVSAIAAGSDSVLASRADGSVYTWGESPQQMVGEGGEGFFYIENAPQGFGFVPRRELDPGAVATSNTVVLSGLFAQAPANVAGGLLSVNGGAFGTGPFSVNNGDTLQVRMIAAPAYSTSAAATVSVGAASQSFSLTTRRDPDLTASYSPQLGGGDAHSAILTSEGLVWSWGYNGNGQLGNGSTISSSRAFAVAGLTGIARIAAGGFHTLALHSDGSVWSWGWNGAGQLGDGSGAISQRRAVRVAGGAGTGILDGVVAVAAGHSHSLALRSDGTVWAWGGNGYGQLGDGTGLMRTIPVQVAGLAGVIAIAAGERHSFAIGANGTLWAWGANEAGQLGDGSDRERLAPVAISSLNGIVAIAGGRAHTLALRADGSLWAWGANNAGQLGIGSLSATNKALPAQTLQLAAGITAVAAGSDHSLALRADGTLFAWGENTNRQLGQNDEAPRSLPTEAGLFSDIARIAAGARHSMAMKADGTLYVFGDNRFGQVRNRSGNYVTLAAALNIMRGDVDVSAAAAVQVSSIGQASTGGSSSSREPRSLVDHGPVTLGAQSELKTITVGPVEAATVQIASVALEPPNPAFAITANACVGILSQGASCTINTRFAPSATGASATFLKISYADALGGADYVPLQGVGTSGASAARMTVSAPALVFASQTQGVTGAVQTLTLASSGTGPLTINAITLTGDFAQTNDCPASLAAGASCSVQVSFTPTLGGIRTGVLTLDTNSSTGISRVNVSGTGVGAPGVDLSVSNSGGGVVTSDPAGIACGATCVASLPQGAAVTLSATPNTGFRFIGWSGACAGNGSCVVTMNSVRSVMAMFEASTGTITFMPNLETGFNLIGNSLDTTLDVVAVFGNQDAKVSGITDNIATVWKWDALNSRWQFHSPLLSTAQNATYAASHNYDVLTSIAAGEGYWVNALTEVNLPSQTGSAFNWNSVNFAGLQPGFNLIAHASQITPSQFNFDVSVPPPATGLVATDNFSTLWAWDASNITWFFYSPLLESSGGLASVKSYADSHFFQHFQDFDKKIDVGIGFWVNKF